MCTSGPKENQPNTEYPITQKVQCCKMVYADGRVVLFEKVKPLTRNPTEMKLVSASEKAAELEIEKERAIQILKEQRSAKRERKRA